MKLIILCIGPQWRGSNANGLFYAFGRNGHAIKIIDDRYYFNFDNKSTYSRLANKLVRSLSLKDYNTAILEQVQQVKPDIVFVFKGGFLLAETVEKIKRQGVYTVNFYPDVSFTAHTSYLPTTLKKYDLIFTTKTFGIRDMKEKLGVKNVVFMPHGFDPNIHRKLEITQFKSNPFVCDVSFIGGHSKKKESILESLKRSLPDISLKIFGAKWDKISNPILQDSIAGFPITNDLYPLCIGSTKINLGLLHEQVSGSSSGDKITSRTFHITGSGGFMIHERTDEVLQYFQEDKEIVCFGDDDELIRKVTYFLTHESKRKVIAEEGYKRALEEHTLDSRAKQIIQIVSQKR